MILIVLFPPQGLVLLVVLSVLGYLGVQVVTNLLAKRGQFSYNWLGARFARALSLRRPALRPAVPSFQEWIEANVSLWLIAWVVTALVLYSVFDALARLYYSSLHRIYVLTVDHVYWGILAMVAGAALAQVVSQAGMRFAMREHYDDYVHRLDRELGFRSKRAAVIAIAVAIVIIATMVFIIPGLLTYTRFSSAGIGSV